MKIDSDLRCAIKSAERAQPSDDWSVREKNTQEAIASLLAKKPKLQLRANHLRNCIKKHEHAASEARESLCKEFGLRENERMESKFEFSHCGDGKEQFVKIGGVIPAKGERWKADSIIAKLAAASSADSQKILKSIGIIWE